MIELPKLLDDTWYQNEIIKIFAGKQTNSKDYYNSYENNTKKINEKINELGINEKDFSEYKGRTMLEELSLAKYEDIERIYKKIPQSGEEVFWRTEINEKGKEKRVYLEEWDMMLKAYNKLISNRVNFKLINEYDIKCCPYCNENFIINRGEKTTLQLDHFFPKSEYPIFALCLYNLIPSCYACNHIKSKNSIGVSPNNHLYDFSKLKITYTPQESDYLDNPEKLEVIFKYDDDTEFSEKMEQNLEVFGIKEAYKNHKDYVQEILKKAQIYNSKMINEIQHNFPELFSSKEELVRIIFGNYITKEELLKRPLSKLTMDLLRELHII